MAKQASRPEIRYVYREDIDRGTWPHPRWSKGYSEDLPERGGRYPLLTKTEAQADAKARGGRAVFIDKPLRAPPIPVARPSKKSHAQIKREVDEVLARKPGYRPWQGTDSNERLVNRVRNSLVSIYLDGVAGVSPVIGEYAWKQIQPDDADAYLQRGREALDVLVSQKAPPSAKGWLAHRVSDLRNLIEKAQAIRDGITRQKMTAEDYAKLRSSLGLR